MKHKPRCLIVSVRFKFAPSEDQRDRVRIALGFTESSGAPYAGWQSDDRTEAIVVTTTEAPGVFLGFRRRDLESLSFVENYWAIETTGVAAKMRADDPLVQAFEIADAFRRTIERKAQEEAQPNEASGLKPSANSLARVKPVKIVRRGDPEG